MYLELDEQQRALAELARDLLGDLSPLTRLHESQRPDPKVWQQLAQAGLTGLGVAEADGGSGGSAVEVAIVLEEAGRAALIEPLRETTGVVAPLLSTNGSPEQRERWLVPVAAGEIMLGVVTGDRSGLPAHRSVAGALVVDNENGRLVPTERLELRAVSTVDASRDLALVTGVEDGDEDVLVGATAERVQAWGAMATAATLVGTSQRLLDIALDHARVREQFARPIGSFQAVQHPLVDVHVAIETARVAVWYAALLLAETRADAARAAAVAKAAADRASVQADRVALQVLGGIGFTWEHELHLLSKRATAWRGEFGSAREHHQRLAASLLTEGSDAVRPTGTVPAS